MDIGSYDAKDILRFLAERFTGIGDMTVTSEPPSTIDASIGKYVVVSLPSRIYSTGGYGRTTARISLWARDKNFTSPNFIGENVGVLSTMQRAVYDKIPYVKGNYSVSNPQVLPGGVKNGFHVWHIQCDLIIT